MPHVETAMNLVWTKRSACLEHHRHCAIYIIAAVLAATVAGLEDSDYKGSQVLRIQFPSSNVWDKFISDSERHRLDVWKPPDVDGWADIRVPGSHVTSLHDRLRHHGLNYHVTCKDVNGLLRKEQSSGKRLKRSMQSNDIIGKYARYEEILDWMDHLARRYPSVVKILELGQTFQGRPMKILKLGEERPNKWKVWIDGGIHAREWIAPATVIFIGNQLLQGYIKKDNNTVDYLRSLDWYLVPVINPDGYEYTHTTDRFWRKNRQHLNNSRCHGIDLNRNWVFEWGGGSSSSNPCNGEFRGSSPEEAAEVKHVADFLSARSGTFIAFITYHSYGQNVITRWDYSKEALPKDHQLLISVARNVVRKMAGVHGMEYQAGRAPEILYPYGGGSPDWAKAVADIKYSYLVELRNMDSFILPRGEIVPTGEENWAGIQVIAMEILENYGKVPVRHVPDPPAQKKADNSDTHVSPQYHVNTEVIPSNLGNRMVNMSDVHLLVIPLYLWFVM